MKRAGDCLPALRGGGDHRGPAADRQAQVREVDFREARMRGQAGVERVHAREDGGRAGLKRVDQSVDVARIRHQPVLGADREVGDEVHHQREDVIERNAVTITSSPGRMRSRMKALNCSVLATRLRCDRQAPLDTPVVPPVYCRNSRSSPVSHRRRGSPWACLRAGCPRRPACRLSRASTGGPGTRRRQPSPGRDRDDGRCRSRRSLRPASA